LLTSEWLKPNEVKPTQGEIDIAHNYMGFHERCTATYFDHKLPDYVSTARRALLYGEVMQVKNGEIVQPKESYNAIIINCDRVKKDEPALRINRALEAEACPSTYYKNITYKDNTGHDIPKAWLNSTILEPVR